MATEDPAVPVWTEDELKELQNPKMNEMNATQVCAGLLW